jgi:hypothetical protein
VVLSFGYCIFSILNIKQRGNSCSIRQFNGGWIVSGLSLILGSIQVVPMLCLQYI